MSLRVYNTLVNDKVKFETLEPGKVKMYVCGPTVYDFLHIGNFRGAIFFNLVRNWLEASGYEVTYVYNYTDVDDKIIKRANDEGVECSEITEKYIAEFETDFNNLGLKKHDFNPRVTEFMPQIIETVESIIKNGKAYEVEGEVYYDISSFEDYGKLSGKKLDELESARGIEVDKKKRHPSDFVLWKPSKEGEPSWDSPWGKGRPGWHIECTAMIRAILGDTIDIHGGGVDLQFPHHENEIAQGEGASGHKYCNCWMHNNFINFKDEKMSKSLGNVITGRRFMEEYHPEILKYGFLSAHYRTLMSLNDEKIEQTICALSRVYSAKQCAEFVIANVSDEATTADGAFLKKLDAAHKAIKKSLDDDFNTAEFISHVFEVVRAFNSLNIVKKPNAAKKATSEAFINFLNHYGKMSALFYEDAGKFLGELDEILVRQKGIDKSLVEDLIKKRNEARDNKDWDASDKFRDELAEIGVEPRDGDPNRAWEVKK